MWTLPSSSKEDPDCVCPCASRQNQIAAWTSTVAIIPTQYHEPPPNARPQYACGRPLSHEQCKEGKTQQNSETRVFLRVHPFLSMDEQCPLVIKTNGENKHISDLFSKNVSTVSPQPNPSILKTHFFTFQWKIEKTRWNYSPANFVLKNSTASYSNS